MELNQEHSCKICEDDTEYDIHNLTEEEWISIVDKKRNEKINMPCWFFNNGGCRHKDGRLKSEKDCKYLHVYSNHIIRPPHLISGKPCDKFNLEGYCRWKDHCKYSHRLLTEEEWNVFYPTIPYALRFHIHRRQYLENKIDELQNKINILEFKLNSMDELYENKLLELENKIN